MIAKPCALTALTGGGFTFETSCLLKTIANEIDFIYLKTPFGGMPGEGHLPSGEFFLVPPFASVTRPSVLQSVKAFWVTFFVALKVLHQRKPSLVFIIGCSHAVPLLMASRLLGTKSVYIESVTRADKLSRTGMLVYRLNLAKEFLVQWPGLKERYPASRLGTIL